MRESNDVAKRINNRNTRIKMKNKIENDSHSNDK